MKTWDLLDRETGMVRVVGWASVDPVVQGLYVNEVAWCRETGEVVYR